ncbi:hypothetical protein F3G61_31460 [Pseudomonas aeruginosa]|nr:hypothetical protein F3G61_31460 [Pseudomonas aeruginosa]
MDDSNNRAEKNRCVRDVVLAMNAPHTVDRQENKQICSRELRIETRLSTICYQKVLGYFGHIARRPPENLERLIVVGKVEGKRPAGRPPNRWSDQITALTGLSVANALREAENRRKWKLMVQRATKGFQGHDLQQ